MFFATAKLDRLRQAIAISFLFAAFSLILQEMASASCGDYLLHGPALAGEQHRLSDVPGRSGLEPSDRNRMPSSTPSPCAGGRCKQAPVPDPPSVPSRVIVLKQLAFGLDDAYANENKQHSNWARSSNEQLFPSPFLAVEIHPPIAA